MDAKLADAVRQAAADARRAAHGFSEGKDGDALPWAVTAAFDALVRGHVERDPRIEDGRDGVLIAAVGLAEARPEEDADEAALDGLLHAIDGLERTTLAHGVVNRRAAAAGLGTAGQRITGTS